MEKSIGKVKKILAIRDQQCTKDERMSFFTYEDTIQYLKSKDKKLFYTIDAPEFYFSKFVILDTETTGLVIQDLEIIGLGIWDPEQAEGFYFSDLEGIKLCLDYLTLHKIKIGCHNLKYDYQVLKKYGYNNLNFVDDSMLACYILYPEDKSGLKFLTKKYLGLHIDTFDEVTKGKNISEIDTRLVADYCINDCYHTYLLLQYALEKLNDREKKLYELECKVALLLADMEYTGIRLSIRTIEQMIETYSQEIEDIKAKIPFNPGSFEELNNYLYTENSYQYTDGCKVKVTIKGYSTDNLALSSIAHLDPIIPLVLEYRALVKAKSTYLVGLLNKVKGNKLHTNYNQTVTVTGRLSSSKPNLQNIPPKLRNIFTPKAGYKLLALDYSQCELRILAHYTREPVLINAYKNNLDIHTEVAKMLLNKDEITKEERRFCKIINFGVIYGMTPIKLSNMLEIPIDKATELFNRYWEKMPLTKRWMLKIYKSVLENNYVETILGRKRWFEFEDNLLKAYKNQSINIGEIPSIIKNCRYPSDQGIFREAGNAPIQGSNADITKLAMVASKNAIQEYYGKEVQMLLQIHDELVFQVRSDLVEELALIIKAAMESVSDGLLNVPLVVDYHIGDNWSECK